MSGGALTSILGRLLPRLIKPATSVLTNILGIDGALYLVLLVQFKKTLHGTGTAVIFPNEEVNDMIKIVKALEDSDILVKGSAETLQNDIKKDGALPILPMLLGSLGIIKVSFRYHY